MVWSITIIKSFFLLRKTAERQKNPVTSGKTKVEIYTNKLEMAGMHRHFILFGLMHHLERRLNQRFSPDEVLQLLDRFFNLDLLEPDDEELELVNHKEDFSLPQSILEEIKRKKISS